MKIFKFNGCQFMKKNGGILVGFRGTGFYHANYINEEDVIGYFRGKKHFNGVTKKNIRRAIQWWLPNNNYIKGD